MRIGRSELRDKIEVRRKSGNGTYGAIYSGIEIVPCLMEQGFRRITDAQGREVISSAFLFVMAGANVTIGDKIISETGQYYEVIQVQPQREHHTEVYLTSIGSLQ